MPRYNGFTCPACGGHHFTTNSYPQDAVRLPDESLRGKIIGRCTSQPAGLCDFSWERGGAEEDSVMYQHTREEHLATYSGDEKTYIYVSKLGAVGNMLRRFDGEEERGVVVREEGDWYRSTMGHVIRRECGKSPNGNQFSCRWVLRDENGAYIDHDQYRNDLFERWNLWLL